jgi:hypothetical protein
MFRSHAFLIGFILQHDIQNLFNYFLQTIFALTSWWIKHIYHLSLFNIFCHDSFCYVKTFILSQDTRHFIFFVMILVMVSHLWMYSHRNIKVDNYNNQDQKHHWNFTSLKLGNVIWTYFTQLKVIEKNQCFRYPFVKY